MDGLWPKLWGFIGNEALTARKFFPFQIQYEQIIDKGNKIWEEAYENLIIDPDKVTVEQFEQMKSGEDINANII